MTYIIIILIIVIIVLFALSKKNGNIEKDEEEKEIRKEKNDNFYPYHSKMLLTKNEYYFFKKLKDITDEKNLQILAKIRLADLVEVNQGTKDWNKYFNRIKSKHIDFAIADNMKIIALIELDDSSHEKDNRVKRDDFVNNVLSTSGYTIIRTKGETSEIENFLLTIKN